MTKPRSQGRLPFLVKSLCAAVLVIVVALAGYWVKCQLGINIIPGYEWEKHLPFLKSFQKTERVIRPAPGRAFTSTFDGWLPLHHWSTIWARDAGTVRAEIVPDGSRGSKALLIRSESKRDWAFPSNILFEVSSGDVFVFSGYARTGGHATSQMGVVFYDALDKVTKWNGAAIPVKSVNWQPYDNRFVVPEGTARMRYRVTGWGIGECYFDDLVLLKAR